MAPVIYTDQLVEITGDGILFRNYYFPFGSKKIRFEDIAGVTFLNPTLKSGKWRIHGTGDFRTWFPRDWKRPTRDMIFVASFHSSRRRIGFTVENSERVKAFFIEKKLAAA